MRNRSAPGIERRGNRDACGRIGPERCFIGAPGIVANRIRSGVPADRESNGASGTRDRPRPGERDVGGGRGRFRRTWIVGAAVMVVAGGGAVQAELLAGWNFNAADTSSGSLLADFGSGRLEFASIADRHDLFGGTSLNAWGDLAPGDALGFRGPAAESGSMFLDWDPIPEIGGGPRNLQCSFATRRSGTGSDQVDVDAWSGSDWVPIASIATATDWSTAVFGLDGVGSTSAEVRLRFTFTGASSPQGTLRFDNLRIDAATIPAPGVLATVGLLLPRLRHRRRR
ncbi:MAG: hypothetical protein CMJ54_10650 [Planctomycetaceae bacterium]|nr:hypothetical protein [Planctomycetaceae bacterium]